MNTKFSSNTIIRLLLISLIFSLAATPTVTQAAANKIYYTTSDDYSVKRADIDGTNLETLHTSATGTPCGITIDPVNHKIYFTDYHASVSKIQRMNLDGTNLEDVVTGVMAISIALDRFAGKIYYTTKDDYSVKRANTDGTSIESLYTPVTTSEPYGIALDTKNGKVYFTDNNSSVKKIYRMNLDGTSLEEVLTGVQAISIVLDVDGGKMYFTTSDDWRVKRADMDGTDVETLYTSATGTPNGITLDLDSDKIYFTDNYSSVKKIQRMDLDGSNLEDVLTDVASLNIVTDPPVPTAITMKDFTARNRASPGIWIIALIIIFILSKMAGKKSTEKQNI
jgi:DNA-binding beta-propeller fold protein YncE